MIFGGYTVVCVQISPISFASRGKGDVCVKASLIVFQYPAVFQEFTKGALIGCLTGGIIRFNSDWLPSETLRIIYEAYLQWGFQLTDQHI